MHCDDISVSAETCLRMIINENMLRRHRNVTHDAAIRVHMNLDEIVARSLRDLEQVTRVWSKVDLRKNLGPLRSRLLLVSLAQKQRRDKLPYPFVVVRRALDVGV